MNSGRFSVANARPGATDNAARDSGFAARAGRIAATFVAALALCACGQRGPLTLPAGTPAASSPASAP